MTVREEGVKLIALMEKESQFKTSLDGIEVNINELSKQIQSEESEKSSIQSNYSQLLNELTVRQQQLNAFNALQSKKEQEIVELTEQNSVLSNEINQYESEILTPLANKLTDAEADELSDLVTRERTVLQAKEASENEFASISADFDRLGTDLRDNLLKRKAELDIELLQLQDKLKGNKEYDSKVEYLRSHVEQLEKLVADSQKEINEVDKTLQEKKKELIALDKEIEGNKQSERQIEAKIGELSHTQDKLLNKRSMFSLTVQEKQNALRDLQGVSQKELDLCKGWNDKQLMSKLKEVNEKFKAFTHVNRKALDQYISFNQKRETLISRKGTVEKEYNAIQLLINNLDEQKEEAILKTFENVQKHFGEVFQELVPGGTGELVMIANGTSSQSQVTNGENTVPEDPFEGVAVRVSFVASGEQYELQQLSGGQKAVVALALIFAIQRTDPAPFYLFDELDQALDANYRAAVARLIERQAKSTEAPAQFITTTFRPELVAVAEKWYEIGLENKVSNIYSVDKREAQSFVAELMNEEEAVGAVSSVDQYAPASSHIQSIKHMNIHASPRVSTSSAAAVNKVKVQETLLEEEEEDEDLESSEEEEEVKKKSKKGSKPLVKSKAVKSRYCTRACVCMYVFMYKCI